MWTYGIERVQFPLVVDEAWLRRTNRGWVKEVRHRNDEGYWSREFKTLQETRGRYKFTTKLYLSIYTTHRSSKIRENGGRSVETHHKQSNWTNFYPITTWVVIHTPWFLSQVVYILRTEERERTRVVGEPLPTATWLPSKDSPDSNNFLTQGKQR